MPQLVSGIHIFRHVILGQLLQLSTGTTAGWSESGRGEGLRLSSSRKNGGLMACPRIILKPRPFNNPLLVPFYPWNHYESYESYESYKIIAPVKYLFRPNQVFTRSDAAASVFFMGTWVSGSLHFTFLFISITGIVSDLTWNRPTSRHADNSPIENAVHVLACQLFLAFRKYHVCSLALHTRF